MTEARIEHTGQPAPDGAGAAALRIAVVGPTHPHTGGIAAHTTMLAHHLHDAGHDVVLVSWAHLHPSRLHRDDVTVPRGGVEVPEVPPFPRTIRALSWARPDTWVRVGRRLRDLDAVVVVHAIPPAVPAHLALLRAAGALPTTQSAQSDAAVPTPRPQSIVVCHTVLPLEPRPGDARLMGLLLSRVDSVLVHSADQARLAHDLGARRVSVADLPPHVPGGHPISRGPRPGPTRLLALGLVREHKGIDVLLRAMRTVPEVTLTIAGEMSGSVRRVVATLSADPSLAGRVEIREGYVPADALAALLADHDVLALPYRSATASQNVVLGHAHGLPVLASDVVPFSQQVVDGVNGLLVPPDDERALAGALRRLGDPELRRRLADGVQTPDLSGPWAHYLGTIEALSLDDSLLGPGAEPVDGTPAPRDDAVDTLDDDEQRYAASPGSLVAQGSSDAGAIGGARTRAADLASRLGAGVGRGWASVSGAARHRVRRSLASHRDVLDLRPEDVPDWVLATDVLGDPAEADDAKHLARILGLPRSLDSVSSWAALGALAAILRVRDDGRRSAVIVDETGSRSLLSRWARAVGFAPVEIEFTGAHPSVAALDVDTGSLDVIVRIHPRGCDASDITQVLEQASWALRSGGLLIVTVPIGPPSAEGAVGPADVRGILARAHDLGFVLVGDLDGDVTARMREAAGRARADDAAYGLVRLTLRRR
ncbi:glycosyltransferase involved in cell wall biosynthesis [Humibacillus xanthopallidus]|uniref:D-inositol 3-phosphate glycosyltransferase n=1 Tax=Humibacillus xanthopallidus TaxID=412689 RepID=A0A543PX25_9MICO|nr:glycosyltransferase family 4 protein [Humibacillus xanthopallidus]TQN48638.1 glycosyltransferase involved in cell wall biosynthesis [Humibacillus xanthopallidus]